MSDNPLYDGALSVMFSGPPLATGGVITTDGAYTVHTFTTDGTLVCSGTCQAEVLVVGGGGGGSSGGGGAGGYLTGAETLTGSMPVTVGAGGDGLDSQTNFGVTGGDSVFGARTAKGGGGGGRNDTWGTGVNGASGGGGAVSGSGTTVGGAATPSGQGNDGGGNGGFNSGSYPTGGGGGAGAAGQTAPDNSHGGDGGAGLTWHGLDVAGGGGGAVFLPGTPGTASHGGGAGTAETAVGMDATANTGGGGGGSGQGFGGAGADGIVVVRYQTGFDVTADLLPGLGYSSTNPGGFGETTLRLPAASPWGTYSGAVAKGAAVVITHGAQTLFEGEVTNDCTHAVVDGGTAYYEITAAGLWYKAGQRGDYCATYADRDYGQWFTLGTNAQQYQTDTDGKLEITVDHGQRVKANKGCALYYWLEGGLGNPASTIRALLCKVVVDVTNGVGNWAWTLDSSDSPWGSWTNVGGSNNYSDTGFYWDFPMGAGVRALRLRLYPSTTVGGDGETTDRYVRLEDVAVVTTLNSGGLAITGISQAAPAVFTTVSAHALKVGDTVYISDSNSEADVNGWWVVATVPLTTTFTLTGCDVGTAPGDAGTLWTGAYPGFAMVVAAISTGLAGGSDYVEPAPGNTDWSTVVRPHVSRAEAIESLAATFADPIDYGFWDGAEFYCKARVAAAGARDILIDSSVPGIDFAVFKNTEDTPDVVKVLYTFRDVAGGVYPAPDGVLLAVYRDANGTFSGAWDDAAYKVEVWDDWADTSLEAGQAIGIGDQIIAWLGTNAYQGTVTIATPTVPLRGGGTKLTAYIRAGDYIECSQLSTGPLMVTSMEMDVDSGVATLGIGETRAEFVARIGPRRPRPWERGPGHWKAPT